MANRIYYQVESYTAIIDELKVLHPDHFVADGRALKQMNMDYERYIDIDKKGNLLCYVARNCGKVVGYIVAFASTDFYSKHIKQMFIQEYYVVPEYRKSGVAIHMFRALEGLIEGSGISEMHVSSRLKYDKLFEFLGWTLGDHLYIKKVGKYD